MRCETLLGQFLPFGAGTAVIGVRIDADAAAGRKEARHFDVLGIHQFDQILHDRIDDVFVEIAVAAETEQIEFQALALNHAHVGNVGDADLRKVRLAGNGAERREFRAVETDPVIVLLVHVLEGLEHLRRIVLTVLDLRSEGLQVVFLAVHDYSSPASLSRSAFSAIVSWSMHSWMSPSMKTGRLYMDQPMRWSVTRPCG